jgi:hypothetical protein
VGGAYLSITVLITCVQYLYYCIKWGNMILITSSPANMQYTFKSHWEHLRSDLTSVIDQRNHTVCVFIHLKLLFLHYLFVHCPSLNSTSLALFILLHKMRKHDINNILLVKENGSVYFDVIMVLLIITQCNLSPLCLFYLVLSGRRRSLSTLTC